MKAKDLIKVLEIYPNSEVVIKINHGNYESYDLDVTKLSIEHNRFILYHDPYTDDEE